MARKELEPEDLTAIIDTREQLPLALPHFQVVRGTLETGDYSIAGLEKVLTVERKGLDDLLGCIGQHRKRFDDEMQRILAYPHRMLVIECTWRDIEAGMWRSRVTPAAVRGSLMGWLAMGIPIFFARDHVTAAGIVAHFMFLAARRRWREAVSMCDTLKIATKETDIGPGNA
jgi:ERCC4-type nuclease